MQGGGVTGNCKDTIPDYCNHWLFYYLTHQPLIISKTNTVVITVILLRFVIDTHNRNSNSNHIINFYFNECWGVLLHVWDPCTCKCQLAFNQQVCTYMALGWSLIYASLYIHGPWMESTRKKMQLLCITEQALVLNAFFSILLQHQNVMIEMPKEKS